MSCYMLVISYSEYVYGGGGGCGSGSSDCSGGGGDSGNDINEGENVCGGGTGRSEEIARLKFKRLRFFSVVVFVVFVCFGARTINPTCLPTPDVTL